MQAALVQRNFRGVLCRYCGRPIPISASILGREFTFKQNESIFLQQGFSIAFSHRCKRCAGEAIYALSQVLDCKGHHCVPNQTDPGQLL